MKGDRIHAYTVSILTQVIDAVGTGNAGQSTIIDLPLVLSKHVGKTLPYCAIYDVTRVTCVIYPSGTVDEDVGFMARMRLFWCSPTAQRIAALKWASREFFRERSADYANVRGLQFAPKLTVIAAPVETHFSRRDIGTADSGSVAGQIYTLAGASDATHWGIMAEYIAAHPARPAAPMRTGAQSQVVDLTDSTTQLSVESSRVGHVGYGIGTVERFANNASGPEDAATPFLTVAAEDPAVWVHHSRNPVLYEEFDCHAPPGRSYPWTLGQAVLAVEAVWPVRKTGMWGGNDTATIETVIECVGWHELR